jgi:hypothetical protein
MHKLEIKLKQHTPLIHFQPDQVGATLRASEVKPKLDKYIINKAFHDNFDECKEFLVGYDPDPKKQENSIKKLKSKWDKGYRALNYKICIKREDCSSKKEFLIASYIKDETVKEFEKSGINILNCTPYFAQEKQNGELSKAHEFERKRIWDNYEKKGLLESRDIIINIVWFNTFTSWINEIQPFFISTNFGTRQSKGFGSFEVIEMLFDNNAIAKKSVEEMLKQNFKFVFKKVLFEPTLAQIFSTINDDYKLIKSGRTRPYLKSKLMLFGGDVGWDKKFIKEQIDDVYENEKKEGYLLKCKPQNKKDNYRSCDEYKFFRALLGLAEHYEFLLENPPAGKPSNKLIVKISHPDIKRYQSPLLFKVIGNNIYLVGNDVDSRLFSKHFDLFVTIKGDKAWLNDKIEGIDTPDSFSLINFIRFAMRDNTNLNYVQLK